MKNCGPDLRCSLLLEIGAQTTTTMAASERWRRGAWQSSKEGVWGPAQLGWWKLPVQGWAGLAHLLQVCGRWSPCQHVTWVFDIWSGAKSWAAQVAVLTQCGDSCKEQRWLFYVFSHWRALLSNVHFLIKKQSILFDWQPQWMKSPRGK